MKWAAEVAERSRYPGLTFRTPSGAESLDEDDDRLPERFKTRQPNAGNSRV